jgi:hypothetical protein
MPQEYREVGPELSSVRREKRDEREKRRGADSYHVLVSKVLRAKMGAVPLPASRTKCCGGIRSGKGGSHGKETTSGGHGQSVRISRSS